MIRFFFRFIGLLCLAAAFFWFVYDVAKIIVNPTMSFFSISSYTTIDKLWNELSAKSLEEILHPLVAPFADSLWDRVFLPLLDIPACLIFLILGSVLMMLGRKRRPLIGYARGD